MISTLATTKLLTHTLRLTVILIAYACAPTQADSGADPYLVQAFEGVWKMERSATTLLSDHVNTQVENGVLRHEPPVKDAPVYLYESYEVGSIEYRRNKYSANTTPWGGFPHLNPDTMRLLEIGIPQTRYLVLSAEGEKLFSTTSWRRYRFLHVFDIGRGRHITNHYPVFAEAHLGERVLGRLPNSAVLNYARVVPSSWDSNNNINQYEVLLYNLDRKGITRTLNGERPVAYKLTKNIDGPLWKLEPTETTPIADELDRQGHYFTGARLSRTEHQARQLTATQAQRKKINKK